MGADGANSTLFSLLRPCAVAPKAGAGWGLGMAAKDLNLGLLRAKKKRGGSPRNPGRPAAFGRWEEKGLERELGADLDFALPNQ